MGAPINVNGSHGNVEVKLGQPPSAMRSTGGVGCLVNHGNGPAIQSGYLMSQESAGCGGGGGGGEKMNPGNMMPMNAIQELSPGQPFPLSVGREGSIIPKAEVGEKWVYSSEQMLWDTMTRKGWKWQSDQEKEKNQNPITIHNRECKSRKNDFSKKLADQRWRQSMNANIESLRRVLSKDFVFRDGTIIKRRECRSRNDLLAKVSDLISDLEKALNTQCSGSSPALSPNDNLNAIKNKFKIHQREKEKNETPSAKSRKNSENFLPVKCKQ
ncbi:uncharacterized protein LOC128387833 [Panonychus citri]|uniref:uncharacterized protein LOC128387833 n=1 Tax=Panonychus citri TaxID=50023 RepID=UPI0023081747|nr:uncharacterized protein LOC128387833 [Panonychus citri]